MKTGLMRETLRRGLRRVPFNRFSKEDIMSYEDEVRR